ncbi:hypothetical protein CA606_03340 [Caulobacter vibrioides]|uniref:Uncharacterized protein n=1 Tax=Caulobacter vibrioides TaxID=155892 RepID=A0A290MV30_CAUVI|nr:hypothetical protein CA606_03340 [Caulobacter vibrioides]
MVHADGLVAPVRKAARQARRALTREAVGMADPCVQDERARALFDTQRMILGGFATPLESMHA